MKKIISEKSLSRSFRKILSKPGHKLSSNFYHIITELEGKQGIPDYVASTTRINISRKLSRKAISESMQKQKTALILTLLSETVPHTVQFISLRSGLTISEVSLELRKLRNTKLVIQSGKKSYKLSHNIHKLKIEFWAFEIKVENWRRAFYQALQFKAFAHLVFIVIPEKYVKRAERQIDMFKTFNIGLIALDHLNDKIRFVYFPKKKAPASKMHYYYAIGKFITSTK